MISTNNIEECITKIHVDSYEESCVIYKCKCNQIGSKYCVSKLCKNCCDDLSCENHKKNKNKSKIKVYTQEKTTNKKNNKKCNVCKVGDLLRPIIDVEHCNNEECETHYYTYNCEKCNEQCRDKYNGYDCHYELCKKCCSSFDCEYHFLPKDEFTTETLESYKQVLLDYKIKIPEVLVNIIVDQYIDDLYKCYICNNKYAYEGDVIVCDICNKHSCGECSQLQPTSSCYIISCYYCMSGRCYNNKYKDVCINCYEEPKYKTLEYIVYDPDAYDSIYETDEDS
jgi:hypothetical protein